MITAAIFGTTVSPQPAATISDQAAITSEIAERIGELNAIKAGSGTDLILRLASIARLNRGALDIVVAVLHGDTAVLTDSYSERAASVGRKKQTVHYRTLKEIEAIEVVFPEVAAILSGLRLSVKHHEDPVSNGQVIREAREGGD